jgi:hypothetical protein
LGRAATLGGAWLAILLAQGCATPKETQPIPLETHDGLVLQSNSKVARAYLDPNADFSVYEKIMILDCHVAFRKNWQRDQRRSGAGRAVRNEQVEKIKAGVARLFREVFSEKLAQDGGYAIVDTAGEDVLLVRPAILDLDINAPDDRGADRSTVYTSTSGAATLLIELYDSETGDILARAADRKTARSPSGQMTWTTTATSRSNARRVLGRWADLLRERLDEFHAAEPDTVSEPPAP